MQKEIWPNNFAERDRTALTGRRHLTRNLVLEIAKLTQLNFRCLFGKRPSPGVASMRNADIGPHHYGKKQRELFYLRRKGRVGTLPANRLQQGIDDYDLRRDQPIGMT